MVIEAVKRIFVDTNILIFATNELSIWHHPSIELLQTANNQGIELIISPQILREYLAATTRLSITGSGLPLIDILANLQVFQAEFTLVQDDLSVLAALVNLLENFPTADRQVYDTNIVATMQVYGVHHLLTHNIADFARFSPLITIIPLEVRP